MVRSGRVFANVPSGPVVPQMADLNTMEGARVQPAVPAVPNLHQRRNSRNGDIASNIQLDFNGLDRHQHRDALVEGTAAYNPLPLDGFEFGSLNAFNQAKQTQNNSEFGLSDEEFKQIMADVFSGGQQDTDGFRHTDEQTNDLMQGGTFSAPDSVDVGTQVSGAGASGQGDFEGGEEGGYGNPLGSDSAASFLEG